MRYDIRDKISNGQYGKPLNMTKTEKETESCSYQENQMIRMPNDGDTSVAQLR